MVQATGDMTLRNRLNYIIDQLIEVQAAHGSGYMLSIRNGKKFFANVAAGNIQIDGLPWNGYQINGLADLARGNSGRHLGDGEGVAGIVTPPMADRGLSSSSLREKAAKAEFPL